MTVGPTVNFAGKPFSRHVPILDDQDNPAENNGNWVWEYGAAWLVDGDRADIMPADFEATRQLNTGEQRVSAFLVATDNLLYPIGGVGQNPHDGQRLALVNTYTRYTRLLNVSSAIVSIGAQVRFANEDDPAEAERLDAAVASGFVLHPDEHAFLGAVTARIDASLAHLEATVRAAAAGISQGLARDEAAYNTAIQRMALEVEILQLAQARHRARRAKGAGVVWRADA